METSRHSSPAVLVAAMIAGSAFLIQHNGFFEGAFRTDILASVKAEDVLTATDLGAMSHVQAVDRAATASIH